MRCEVTIRKTEDWSIEVWAEDKEHAIELALKEFEKNPESFEWVGEDFDIDEVEEL